MEEEAKLLNRAMKDIGTDENRIIQVLTKHNTVQRQEIQSQYKKLYGRTLLEDLESESSGNFLKCLKIMLKPTIDYEAECVQSAMKGVGFEKKILIELICSKNNEEIKQLSDAFKKLTDKDLEKEIESEAGGDFGKVLRLITSGSRAADSTPVDTDLAKKESEQLYQAGLAKIGGTDEDEFIRILCTRSFSQLKATFEEYKKTAGAGIEKSIKYEMSSNLEKSLLTIAKCVQNRPKYFAELIFHAVDGLGTADDDLMRVIVTRSERDMDQIQAEYATMYAKKSKSLSHAIKKDTSGYYEKLLLQLIETNKK